MAKQLKILEGGGVLTASISATTAAVLAATAISAGVSTYSAVAQGEAADEAAKVNAENAKARAHVALQNGAIAAADKKDKARRIASQQAEAASAAGFRIDSGTPLALLTETAGLGDYESRIIMNNAQKQAYGFQTEADIFRMQGRAASSAGKLNGAGTFLGSMGGMANTYYNMEQS